MKINKVKISQLPEIETLEGFATIGVGPDGKSYKADLGMVGEAATAAQTAADRASASANVADQSAQRANESSDRATAAAQKANQSAERAENSVLRLDELTVQVNDNTADIQGLTVDLHNEEHFRGYLSTRAELERVKSTPNDYAYVAEVVPPSTTSNKWVYANVGDQNNPEYKWVDSGAAVPDKTVPPWNNPPLMDGLGDPGVSATYARGNHRHPSDTTKQDKLIAGENIIIYPNNVISAASVAMHTIERTPAFVKTKIPSSAACSIVFRIEGHTVGNVLPSILTIVQARLTGSTVEVFKVTHFGAEIAGMLLSRTNSDKTVYLGIPSLPSQLIGVTAFSDYDEGDMVESISNRPPSGDDWIDPILFCKQDKLTAGENITISADNVISATASGVKNIEIGDFDNFNPLTDTVVSKLTGGEFCLFTSQYAIGRPIENASYWVGRITCLADGIYRIEAMTDVYYENIPWMASRIYWCTYPSSCKAHVWQIQGKSEILSNQTNGYAKFPSGLTMQWGYVAGLTSGSHTITFPIAFSAAPHVFLTNTVDSTVGYVHTASGYSLTATKASVKASYASSNTGGNDNKPFRWFAMGFSN